MMPMYGYMDSHPFQKNQMSFGQYQYPSMEAIPSHGMMDPAKSCMPYDTWPNGSYYGYPMPYNSCCSGGNLPCYYSLRPPLPHAPPHQYMHCYGRYPPCPQYAPPPYYNMEQPIYEFDKNMMRNHHCCGCPNSLCNQMGEKSMKIEEEEPGIQKKGSLIPIQFGNNQCPIVWNPSDAAESKKGREPSETATVKQEKEHINDSDSFEKAPKLWSGWPLFDRSGAEWMSQSMQNKPREDKKKEIPFPIIWMPAGKDMLNIDASMKPTDEPLDTRKLSQTSTVQKDDGSESNRIEEKSIIEDDAARVGKKANQKNIPVEDMNQKKTEHAKEEKERGCIPVKTVKVQSESSETNGKTQSLSSPKKSKLPPVCLRVDPLPKKKNGNGHSKSHNQSTASVMKESSQQDSKSNGTFIGSEPIEPKREKIVKPVEVKAYDSDQGNKENIIETKEKVNAPTNSQEMFLDTLCKEETEGGSSTNEIRDKDGELGGVSMDKALEEGPEKCTADIGGDETKTKKASLSDVESSVRIQSAYRGYEVRKCELLKKLRQLAEVRQQVMEVQNHVRALEASPQDKKQRVLIGEMIMRSLLKLDSIQGLHPSVREFRKTLATELVASQEKLDNIMANKSAEPLEEASTYVSLDHFIEETNDNMTGQEQHRDEIVEPYVAQSLSGTHESGVTSETEQDVGHTVSNFRNEDTSILSSENFAQPFLADGQNESSVMRDDKQGVAQETDAVYKAGGDFKTHMKEETAEDPLEVHDSNSVSDNQLRRPQAEPTPEALDELTTAFEENEQTHNLAAVEKKESPMEGIDGNLVEVETLKLIGTEKNVMQEGENEQHLAIESSTSEDGSSSTDKHANEMEGGEDAVDTRSEQQEECSNYATNEVAIKEQHDEFMELPSPDENLTEKNGPQIEDEEKPVEDVQLERCELNLMPEDKISVEGDEELITDMDKKLVEENERMREMVEKLMEAGKEQLMTISQLSGRVKELEKKLARKRPRRKSCRPISGSPMRRRHIKA